MGRATDVRRLTDRPGDLYRAGMSQAIRKTVHFAGHVQGVGFRWTTKRIARGYDVSGYVKNLPDGRVELVVEGPADVVRQMLAELGETMRDNIREMRADTAEASGEFRAAGFVIRH